jgi:uncharacterized protein (TIGR03790 family)
LIRRLLAALIVAHAAAASGLTAREVAVIANANSDDSLALAAYYMKARGIPQQHLIPVRTTTRYLVSRQSFNKDIRDVIRDTLRQRELHRHVRSLCLMWGVPVRVAAPVSKEAGILRRAAQRARHRLALDYRLITAVARDFAEPRTEGLEPVAKLFSPPPPVMPANLPTLKQLEADIPALLKRREAEVRRLTDPAKRKIAWRQLMALRLDIYGLEGLIEYVESAKPEASPPLAELKRRSAAAKQALAEARRNDQTSDDLLKTLAQTERVSGLMGVAKHTSAETKANADKPEDASVDSELALLWVRDYPLGNWLVNPLHWRVQAARPQAAIPFILMTARIDGPTRTDAMRIIKASVETEKVGLKGIAYIDAGGLPRAKKYDANLLQLHHFLKTHTKLPTVLDTKKELFAANSCPHAALYVGWYSLRKYVPAFMWARGAVGWHIASFEAASLRKADTQEWCAKMIQNGVAATVGPVEEPRLGAFPLPQHFFPLLMTGRYTLAECYWRTCPFVSWRMTLIGDPLYNPFKANPQAEVTALPAGLAP